jgi:hypothetical protein
MKPKIEASRKFLRATPAGCHCEAVITASEKALDALAEITETRITLGG